MKCYIPQEKNVSTLHSTIDGMLRPVYNSSLDLPAHEIIDSLTQPKLFEILCKLARIFLFCSRNKLIYKLANILFLLKHEYLSDLFVAFILFPSLKLIFSVYILDNKTLLLELFIP